MDKLRGLSVLLVIGYHAADLTVASGADVNPIIMGVNEFLRPFRIPMLMFLSGLLLSKSMSKKPGPYAVGKIRTLVWPYLIWAGVYLLATDGGADGYSLRAWVATGHMWYVFFLIVFYLAAPFLKRIPYWLIALAAFILSIAGDLFGILGSSTLLAMFSYFAVYFFAGAAVARHGELQMIPGWVISICATAAACLGCFSVVVGPSIAFHSAFTPFSLSGIVAVIGLAQRLPNHPTWLSRVGRNSMAFYAVHYPVMIIVLNILPSSTREWHYTALLTVGILVSLSLHILTNSGHFRWMFVMPWPRRPAMPADSQKSVSP